MKSWRSRQMRAVKSQRRHRRLILIIIAIVLMAIGTLSAFFLSGWLAIEKIEIVNARFAQVPRLEKAIKDYLFSSRFLGFINFRNNIVFLSAKDFQSLVFQDPAVRDFSVIKNFREKSITLDLKERQAKGILCLVQGNQDCYYFDDQGIVFAVSPQTEGNVIFLVKDDSGRLYDLGDKILEGGSFADLMAVWDILTSRFHLDYLQIDASNLTVQTSVGWRIYLNSSDLARIKAAVSNLLQSDFEFNNLDYLDLRYLPIIYWKLFS